MKKNISLLSVFVILASCNSSGSSDSVTTFTPSAVLQGLDTVADQIGEVGGQLAESGARLSAFKTKGGISVADAAASVCTIHADPGTDGDFTGDGVVDGAQDGVVSDSERLSESNSKYALNKLYCTLSLNSNSPETVKGALSTLDMIVCAIEKSTGSAVPYDGVERELSGLTIDLDCATQEDLDDMGTTPGATSITMPFIGTWESTTTPATFPELASGLAYNHGIRLNGTMDDGESLTPQPFTVVAVANFTEETVNTSFEFATFVEGLHGADRSEVTAGKFVKSSATEGELWFEYRDNRVGAGSGDDSGFSRHIRIHGNTSYDVNGNLESVSNFTGALSDVYENEVGDSDDYTKMITVNGTNMTIGITGQYLSFMGGVSAATTFDALSLSNSSCVLTSDGSTSINPGVCAGGSELVISASDVIGDFILPGGTGGDNSSWISTLANQSGIGFTGAVNVTVDAQTADCGRTVCR